MFVCEMDSSSYLKNICESYLISGAENHIPKLIKDLRIGQVSQMICLDQLVSKKLCHG